MLEMTTEDKIGNLCDLISVCIKNKDWKEAERIAKRVSVQVKKWIKQHGKV